MILVNYSSEYIKVLRKVNFGDIKGLIDQRIVWFLKQFSARLPLSLAKTSIQKFLTSLSETPRQHLDNQLLS